MPATATRSQGKGMFVTELLVDNPHANTQDVIEAWQAAGMKGTISASLISKVRSQSGLAGNLRGKRGSGTRTAATGLQARLPVAGGAEDRPSRPPRSTGRARS